MTGTARSGGDARAAARTAAPPTGERRAAAARLLDDVFANSREAIVVVDDVGEIRFATSGAGMLIGFDAPSAIGSSVFEYLHPDDVDAAAQLFVQRLGYDGADLGHHARIRHSSGEWIPTVVTASLVSDPDAGACAITLRPVGDDDVVEQSLRSRIVVWEYTSRLSSAFMEATTSRDVLERIVASIGEIGLLTGAELVEMFLEHEHTGSIERLARWVSPARLADRAVAVHDTPAVQPSVGQLLSELQVIDDTQQLANPEMIEFVDRARAVSLLSTPFSAGAQRGVLVLSRLVPGPDWIAADVELTRNAAGLYGRALDTARSEELLTLTYQQGPLGFSIRTWAGDLVDCNQQYLDLYGLTADAAKRTNLADLVSPAHRASAVSTLDDLRRGDVDRVRTQVELIRADGRRFWAQTHSVPLVVPGRSETLVLTAVEDVTETHAQRTELEHAARHDSLTGVANRAGMSESIDRFAALDGTLPAVVVIDLDRFKLVNDSSGHSIGDQVLRTVATRITGSVRAGDVVARLGGDEFAMVVPHLTRDRAHELARRLHAAFDAPIEAGGRSIRQTVSIGIALGDGSRDASDLLMRADRALYAAKARGRNTHVVFDETLEVQVLARQAIERDLRDAIDEDQLRIYYQPEFSLLDGRILGAEALLRWEHPERGLVPADEFITVAEQSGLIDEIGRFALGEACRTFVTIPGVDRLTLRVNISAREFSRPELPELVVAALAASGLEPDRLCLEMTETTLMEEPELALATFARLSQLGVQSAIDDFGTGYSSLAYLKRFPVDVVKIDRAFVDDVVADADSRAIVESILRLGEALSMEAVAEGVETAEQVRALRSLGCERAQGYLVSPALPSDRFAAFLRDWGSSRAPEWLADAVDEVAPVRRRPQPTSSPQSL